MMTCQCELPALDERRPDFCRRCGVRHDPRILSSDQNLRTFFSRLLDLPGVTPNALIEARDREAFGRELHGLRYIGRNNAANGCEKAAEGLVYTSLEWLVDRRAGDDDIDPTLIEAAHYFALAHAALARRRANQT